MMPCASDDIGSIVAGLELATVYVMDRQLEEGGEVGISGCSGRESVIRLIEHSVAGAPAAAFGLSSQRFYQLT